MDGRYLYAIVEDLPRRWRPPSHGVASAPVVARGARDLMLIESAVDAIPPRTPRAVSQHDDVVAATLLAEAVLPIEFGTVVPASRVDAWLDARQGLVRPHLVRVRRHVEMTVRLVSLSRTGRAPLREVADRLVERVDLGQWRYRDDPDGLSSTVAFLVHRDGIGDFLARVAPVASRAGRVAVVPTGPWAPASFSPRLVSDASPPAVLARVG